MECKQIEVYCYYKQQFPEAVVFFRVGENYEAYQMDAQRVSSALGLEIEREGSLDIVRFPAEGYLEYVSKLGSYNIVIKTISYRDKSNKLVLPDLKTIESEKEMDY